MLEITQTTHGFVTSIPKPEYWTSESDKQILRGFENTLINSKYDYCYHCKSDDEGVYILGDVPSIKIFETCIIEGLYYVLQYEFEDKIDEICRDNKEVFPMIFDNIGLEYFFKTEEEIYEIIKNDYINLQ